VFAELCQELSVDKPSRPGSVRIYGSAFLTATAATLIMCGVRKIGFSRPFAAAGGDQLPPEAAAW
jgi:hypothetical protein